MREPEEKNWTRNKRTELRDAVAGTESHSQLQLKSFHYNYY